MFKVIHHTESLIQTVRIECDLINGKKSVGTGFQYVFLPRKLPEKKMYGIRTIVTNKHVIHKQEIKQQEGHFFLNKRSETGTCLYGDRVKVNFDEDEWIDHPDKNVNLTILPMNEKISNLENKGEKLFFVSNLHELVPSDEVGWSRVGPVEDIITVGYPNGLWDEITNVPICRKGITATYANVNYQNKEEFLIDVPIFPGISGSPVFAYGYGNEFYESGGYAVGGKCIFIGILYGGLTYNVDKGGADLYLIPTDSAKSDPYRFLSNLGVVIKSTKLRDFDEILESKLSPEERATLSGNHNQAL